MFTVCGSLCCCSSSTQLQAYALGEMSKGEHLGYSSQGCNTDVGIIYLYIKLESSSIRNNDIIGAIGFIFVSPFLSMVSVVLLQVLLKSLSHQIEAVDYSFDYYGMFWGTSTFLCPILFLLLYRDIAHLSQITFNG